MSVRRRGNGLTADSYVLLLDVDPRLSERLLTALAGAGVAAYSTPSSGRTGPFLELHLPSRPLETVHVDATRRPEARRVLEQTMPDVTVGLPSVEEEDEFAALIAGWDDEPEVHDWPEAEDLDEPRSFQVRPSPVKAPENQPAPTDLAAPELSPAEDATETRQDEADAAPLEKPPLEKPSLEKPSRDETAGQRGHDAGAAEPKDAPEPEDHYVPPPLEPLPPSHPVTKWGLVALGLGLLLLIFPTLVGLEHSTPVDFVGVLCIIGAVGLLVSRLSNRSTGDYEGPDDGAVV